MKRFEYFFVIIALGFGLCFCFFSPRFANSSWDDQIHYSSADSLSYLFSPQYTDADAAISLPPNADARETETQNFSLHSMAETNTEYDSLAADGNTLPSPAFVNILHQNIAAVSSFGYIPSATGLWLARLMHLPFTGQFFIGKMFNLLFFISIVFLGLRKLRSKKLIAGAVAMLPTSLFLASNYSYDPWLTGFTIYGFCYFIGLLQNHERAVETGDLITMTIAFVIGVAPKAVCFPLLFILLLMPKSRFTAALSKRTYNSVVLLGALVCLLSFALPMLASGIQEDARLHSDVNPSAQISWILANFAQYLGMLLLKMGSMCAPFTIDNGYTSFAYSGASMLLYAPLYFYLILLALLDNARGDEAYARPKYCLIAIFWLGVTLALICSALYITYNPVASPHFEGVQGRYLIPLVFPFLALGFNFNVFKKTNGDALAITAASLSTFFLYASFYQIFLGRFVA